MKKLIASLAVALTLGACSLNAQELSVSTTFAVESEYVFRGVQLAQFSFQPGIELGYGGFYTGVWTSQPVDDLDVSNEVDVYLGYGMDVSDMVSLDGGVTYYWYPDFDGDPDETIEAYIGAAFAVPMSPALYLFYDFELEAFTLEGSVGHSIPLDDYMSIDLAAYLGYVDPDEGDGYVYYGASADFVYAFTETASMAVGGRISSNDIDGYPNDANIWFGASFTAGF